MSSIKEKFDYWYYAKPFYIDSLVKDDKHMNDLMLWNFKSIKRNPVAYPILF